MTLRLTERSRSGSSPQGPAAVHDPTGGVLIGQPRRRAMLKNARLAVVANTLWERSLQCGPLLTRERRRVIALPQGLQLTLERVVCQRPTRRHPWRAEGCDNGVTLPGWDVNAGTV